MGNLSFSNVILECFKEHLYKTKDLLIRVDLSSGYYSTDLFLELADTYIVGILSSMQYKDFNFAEYNASTLTKYRNDNSRIRPMIVFGDARGNLESGFKSTSVIVDDAFVCDYIKSFYYKKIDNFLSIGKISDINSSILKNLVTVTFDKCSVGTLNPFDCSNYIGSIFIDINEGEFADMSKIQDNLYLLGLMPDEDLISGKFTSDIRKLNNRFIKNIETLLTISGISDESNDARDRIKHNYLLHGCLQKYIKTKDFLDLQNIELTEVLRLIGKQSTTENPIESTIDIIDIISDSNISRQLRIDSLECIRKCLNEKLLENKLDKSKSITVQTTSMEIYHGVKKKVHFQFSSSEKLYKENPFDHSVLFTYSNGKVSRNFSSSAILNYFRHDSNALSVVNSYLNSRIELLEHKEFLTVDKKSLLSNLVVSLDLIEIAEKYVENWKLMIDYTNKLVDIPFVKMVVSMLDADWSINQDVRDSDNNISLSGESTFNGVSLLPWHPWRLSPLVLLAKDLNNNYADSPQSTKASFWALEKCIPAFGQINSPGNVDSFMEYEKEDNGKLVYKLGIKLHMPKLNMDKKLLERTVESYCATNDWSKAGGISLVINPPIGNFLELLSETTSSEKTFGNSSSIIVLSESARSDINYKADSESVPNLKNYHTSNNLLNSLNDLNFDRDMTFVFLSGLSGLPRHKQGGGAYSSVEISLIIDGLDSESGVLEKPVLDFSPSDKNNVVQLLNSLTTTRPESLSTRYGVTLKKDEIDLLGMLAKRSAWVIVGVPSIVANFSFKEQDTDYELTPVAQYDSGVFRFFVFSKSSLAMKDKLITAIDQLSSFKNDDSKKEFIEKNLFDIAINHPQKLFDFYLSKYGTGELLGIMCSKKYVKSRETPGLSFEVSLDDVSWTKNWLDRGDSRADYLSILLPDNKDNAHIEITVVEAKQRSESFQSPDESKLLTENAFNQVSTTIDALETLFSEGKGLSGTLLQQIRLRSFVEQLSSIVAGKYLEINNPTDEEKNKYKLYFSLISNLTNGNVSDIKIKGLATCLYTLGQNTSIEYDAKDGVTLVSFSDKYVEDLFTSNNPTFKQILNNILVSSVSSFNNNLNNEPQISNVVLNQVNLVSNNDQQNNINSLNDSKINIETTPSIDNLESLTSSKLYPGEDSSVGCSDALNPEEETDIITKLHKAISLRTSDIGKLDFKKIQLKSGPVFHNITFPYSLGGQKSDLDRFAEDIARDTGVKSILFENDSNSTPSIRAIVPRKNRKFPIRVIAPDVVSGNSYLNLSLGMNTFGEGFRCAISDYPHMLVSGTTGSGKTTFVRSILEQINLIGSKYANCIIVDGKGETDYFNILNSDVFHSRFPEVKLVASEAIDVLRYVQEVEVPSRKKLILEHAKKVGGRIDAKSMFIDSVNVGLKPLISPLIIVIDEFNEIMLRGGDGKNAFVDYITSIAQTSRSVLVHLILITQKPERAVLPGTIKANLPTRVAFRLPTATDSVTILGHGGAEKLLGFGDFIFHNNGRPDVRLQGYFL